MKGYFPAVPAKRAFDERKRYACPACDGKRSFAIEKGTNPSDGVGYCFACGHSGFKDTNAPRPFTVRTVKPEFNSNIDSSLRHVDCKTAKDSTNCGHYGSNPLYRYLAPLFGESETASVFQRYHVGTTKQGGVAFWTHDGAGFRSCKVMCYDALTGKRYRGDVTAKQPRQKFPAKDGYEQTVFGLHLIDTLPAETEICIHESEKTALVAALSPEYKDLLHIACGSANGLKPERAYELAEKLNGNGRTIIFIADADVAGQSGFNKAMETLTAYKVKVKYLQLSKLFPDIRDGEDLADLILRAKSTPPVAPSVPVAPLDKDKQVSVTPAPVVPVTPSPAPVTPSPAPVVPLPSVSVTPASVPVAPVARETVFAPPVPVPASTPKTLQAYLGREPNTDELFFYCLEADGTWQDVRICETSAGRMIAKNPALSALIHTFDCIVT